MADGIQILQNLLKAAGLRHGVLSSNIANVDTPGYKAKDVNFEQALGDSMAVIATDPGHMKPGDISGNAEMQASDSRPWVDGNNVELDQEVAKMTENAMLYQAGVSMLSTKIKMFKNALRTR